MRRPKLQTRLVSEVAGYVSERSIGLVLAAASGVIVARHLGPADLGLLSYAGAVFGLLAPLSTLGLPEILLREFSTQSDWRKTAAAALVRQLPVAVVASLCGLLIVVVTRGGDSDAVLIALAMMPLPILTVSQTMRSFLEATGRVRRIVVVGILAALTATGLKIAGVGIAVPVWVFGAALTVEAGVTFAGLFSGLPDRLSPRTVVRHYDAPLARRLVREAAPLLLASLAVMVYMRADLLMLGALAGDRETGIYASAARLSEVWYFIPVAVGAAVRPRLARLYVAGYRMRYEAATQRYMTGLLGIAIGAVVGTLLAADLIVRMLLGDAYSEAANVLRIHILASPFVFLGVAGSQWFVDRGLTRVVMLRSSAGAVLNIAMNLVLIPSMGATGAALATLVAYAASSVLINGIMHETRPLFLLQARAFSLRWPSPAEMMDRKRP